MQTVIVFGGSSFVGRNLCKFLLDKEYQVLSISHRKTDEIKHYGYSEVAFNLENEDQVNCIIEAIDTCDVCIFLTWIGTRDRNNLELNIASAKLLFVLFKKMVAKFPKARFVEIGSAAEYGQHSGQVVTEEIECTPTSPYGVGKYDFYQMACEYSERRDIDFVELRLHSVIGVDDYGTKLVNSVVKKLISGEHVVMKSDCSQQWNFISVNCVCHIIYEMLKKPKLSYTVYNVGCNMQSTLRQYLKIIAEMCGKDEAVLVFSEQKDMLAYDFVFDSSRMQNELGWWPEDDFRHVIKEMIKVY